MSMPVSPALMPYAMTLGLGWVYYRRIRRHIGRQSWQPRRTMVRMALLSLVSFGLVLAGVFLPGAGLAVGIGYIAGIALGFVGMSLTKVENGSEGQWYTPNPWVGGTLAILLVARLAWRLLHLGLIAQPGSPAQASPLTLGMAATLIGYYLTYSLLLMARMRQPATAI